MGAYLMVYHKDADHGLHMAISYDGLEFIALNDDKPLIAGDTIAEQKGIRDPHIFRGLDGTFYLAMTDLHVFGMQKGYRTTQWERDGKKYDWGNNRGLVLMRSTDLKHWTRTNLDFQKLGGEWSEVGCVWAPETCYDEEKGKLFLHFTTRFGNGRNRIYYVYMNDDFTRMESEPKLLFEAPEGKYNVIDSDIMYHDGTYHLHYVSHERGATIKHATSASITGPYMMDNHYYDGVRESHEAPNCWKRIGEDTWVVMHDNFHIRPHNFGFTETKDFIHYTPIGNFGNGKMTRTNFSEQKHGAVIHITKKEARMLEEYWNKKK
ncbi:MAG: glycoside hydrolase family 43 protein [Bacteroidaceae bacterium]|nr:glycoside hydrolase family 43 protein [Bacteroidaceae bacterium]